MEKKQKTKRHYTPPNFTIYEVAGKNIIMTSNVEGNAGVGHGGGTVSEENDATPTLPGSSYLD